MKRKLALILIVLFISIGFWQLLETPIYSQNKEGLTLEQVKNSLNVSNDKKKESAITAKKVRQVGVSFPLTPEIESELRDSGATDELIEAIRENSLFFPTPRPTPILTPRPTPSPMSAAIPSRSDVLEAYSRKQYDQAISLAETLLSVNPKDSQTLALLAQSYFMKDDFKSFEESAIKAIEAGGSLEFSLRHHHSFFKGSLHPVRLVLTGQTISFDPQTTQLSPDSYCHHPVFTMDLNRIVSAELSGNLDNEIYLRLVFTKQGNSKKTSTMRFTDRESYFVTEVKGLILYTVETMVSRRQAFGAMTAIASILNIAKANTAKPTPTPVKSPSPKPEASSTTPTKTPVPKPTEEKKPTSEKQVTSDKKQDTN